MSAIDAVDGSSTGTSVRHMGVLTGAVQALPRFIGARHADDHDNLFTDIAKSVFSQVHGVDARRPSCHSPSVPEAVAYVLAFFQKLSPCLVGIEACGSAHHWSRANCRH